MKFDENTSSGSRVVLCGKTDSQRNRRADMTKLIVFFRNFANVHEYSNDKSNELETKCNNRIAQSYVEAYRVIT
jgi:hypothetical protein